MLSKSPTGAIETTHRTLGAIVLMSTLAGAAGSGIGWILRERQRVENATPRQEFHDTTFAVRATLRELNLTVAADHELLVQINRRVGDIWCERVPPTKRTGCQ